MLTPQVFEYDNGLYDEHQEAPGIFEDEEEGSESIYHLFGNNLDKMLDCVLIPATEEDLETVRKIIEEKRLETEKEADDFVRFMENQGGILMTETNCNCEMAQMIGTDYCAKCDEKENVIKKESNRRIKDGIQEGQKIRIKNEIIEQFNIPKGEQEGFVAGFLFNGEAVIHHTNGKIYDWTYDSFEIIE